MRNAFFALLFIIIGPQAWAQAALPSCWPSQIRGTGSSAVFRETADAEAIGWRCDAENPVRYVRVCRMKLSAAWLPPMDGLTGIGAARAYWQANVNTTCRAPEFREVDDLVTQALRP